MRLLKLKLVPKSPFHLGQRGVGIEETEPLARSDTIFSTLCHCWLMLYGERELEALLGRFLEGEPPFLLSSAFPYAGEVHFLPMPVSLARNELRRTSFVSTGIWRALLEGEEPEHLFVQGRTLWLTRDELEMMPKGMVDEDKLADLHRQKARLGASEVGKEERSVCYYIWRRGEVPHVAVDRASSSSEVFQEGDIYFSEGCGMYILTDLRDEGEREKLLACFRLMGDEGLGGERSSGRGWFSLEFGEEEVPEGRGELVTALSLVNPKDGEEVRTLLCGKASYRIELRRGWIYSPRARNLYKKGVWMLAEGSVLGRTQGPPGRLVKVLGREVAPHDVYKYGFGLTIGLPEVA